MEWLTLMLRSGCPHKAGNIIEEERWWPCVRAGRRWAVARCGGSGERSTGNRVSVRVRVVGLSPEPYLEF
jgi:hypothetical protein